MREFFYSFLNASGPMLIAACLVSLILRLFFPDLWEDMRMYVSWFAAMYAGLYIVGYASLEEKTTFHYLIMMWLFLIIVSVVIGENRAQ